MKIWQVFLLVRKTNQSLYNNVDSLKGIGIMNGGIMKLGMAAAEKAAAGVVPSVVLVPAAVVAAVVDVDAADAGTVTRTGIL